ncbi:hypothetical protein LG293_14815 [Citricoccus nitrophenolicus]
MLIVGGSMAGKTRLALSAAQQAVGDFVFYEPADGKSLHKHWSKEAKIARVLVWLDDLERFAGAGGLNAIDLATLMADADEVVVLATIRTSEYEKFQPTGDLKPPGWDVAAWFGDPVWLNAWSEHELSLLAEVGGDEPVLARAGDYGLSQYLGGAPLVDRRLEIGEAEHSSGYGVVRADADWRRAGLQRPIARDTLVAVLPAYVDSRHTSSAGDQVTEGLAWATTEINQTVVLLAEDAEGFSVLDLVLDRFAQRGGPIPDGLWDAALAVASPAESADIGVSAYFLERLDVAERALRMAATESGAEPSGRGAAATAGFNLGFVLGELGRVEEEVLAYTELVQRYGEDQAPRVREQVAAGLLNRGVMLGKLGRGEEEVLAYTELVQRYGEDQGARVRERVAAGLTNKGVRLGKLGRGEEEVLAYTELVQRYGEDQAPGVRERVAAGLLNRGVRLGELGRVEEEVLAYTELVQRYGEDQAPGIRRHVAEGLFNKGVRLGQLGRVEEEIAAYTDLVQRYGEDQVDPLIAIVDAARRAIPDP